MITKPVGFLPTRGISAPCPHVAALIRLGAGQVAVFIRCTLQAEWPTTHGPEDYVIFAGLKAVAVVEAKRKREDVAGSIEQSKRYSRGCMVRAEEVLPGGPWGEYKVPFLFATNGRPFLRQLAATTASLINSSRKSQHPTCKCS